MKYRTEIVREGERVGDIDWSYHFRSHFDCLCSPDAVRDDYCMRAKLRLHDLETLHKLGYPLEVETSYQFYHKVLDVGMYDGWPYWRPTPAVLTSGPLGPEWRFFDDVTRVEVMA